MASDGSKLATAIDEALQRITEVFLRQCTHGAQTKSLPGQFAACGQFIGEDASRIEQRGLHGIAAALRVLGPCPTEDCRHIVARLVNYCESSFQLHPTLRLEPDQRADDLDNVIKLGELLYSLSFVSASQADVTGLARHLANQLQASLVDNRGWGYFLKDKEPQLLPTAYATRGLAQSGFDVAGPREFILETLRSRVRHSGESSADLTTVVACAYCLTFVRAGGNQKNTVEEAFHSAWRSLEPLLGEDVEQNLEYWRARQTHYVRVPWQLYLLALAAEYSFWRFATFRAQRRLMTIVDALRSASFVYPYSGRYLSSRTNAIAYDALKAVRERVRGFTLLRLANGIDHLRVLAGSRPIRLIAGFSACILIVYSVSQWVKTGTASDLAPNFITGLVVLVLAAARR